MKNKKQASATVESLLILPYVTLFLMAIIWMIDLYLIHTVIGGVVNDVGNELVKYSYPYSYMLDNSFSEESKKEMAETVSSVVFSEGYLRSKIASCNVYSKIENLICIKSIIGKDDAILLEVSYFVRPYIAIPGIKGVYLTNRFYSKAYVGYGGKTDAENEEKVFITENSEVYHTNSDCRALKSTIETVSSNAVDSLRNKDGARYYSCSKCCKNGANSSVYITSYGTKYHNDADCQDLKLTMHEVSKHEAEGKRICKFCQKQ